MNNSNFTFCKLISFPAKNLQGSDFMKQPYINILAQ